MLLKIIEKLRCVDSFRGRFSKELCSKRFVCDTFPKFWETKCSSGPADELPSEFEFFKSCLSHYITIADRSKPFQLGLFSNTEEWR
jgi:hypothetical protein